MLVNEFLEQSAKKYPDNTAVVYHNERVSYADLDRRSDVLASRLLERGVQRDDRVVLLLDNSHKYLIAFFAVFKSGGVVVPLNTQFVTRELEEVINDCSPRLIITEESAQNALQGILNPDLLFTLQESAATEENTFHRHDNPASENELAMIIYTSGATSKPKGVMLSHKNLMANAASIVQYLKLTSADSVMVILPFYYSYGNSLLTTHIIAGATLVIDNRFIYPNVVLDTMEKEKVTGFAGVPSNFAILLRKSALRKYKLSSLRYVTQAGGGMPPSMIREFIDIFPRITFYVMYGQTEASARLTYLAPEALLNKPGSIGKAIPGVEVNILNETGEKVKPGEIGEIVARGENVMLGYWNGPEETATVLRKEGLWTGDLGRMDEEGFIYLVSRKKEMLKSGANRISPFEIEDVVCRLPGVIECAAVGIPDEILGEAIKICVVKDGINLSHNDILRYCKENLAAFKIPKVIEFRKELPKTTTGKIRKKELV